MRLQLLIEQSQSLGSPTIYANKLCEWFVLTMDDKHIEIGFPNSLALDVSQQPGNTTSPIYLTLAFWLTTWAQYRNEQQGHVFEVCVSAHVALRMLLAFSQPVNCIFWPIKTLNWLVAASKLHKRRGTCCTAEWLCYAVTWD